MLTNKNFKFIMIVSNYVRRRNTLAKLTIDRETCKGCGLCADACPKHLLALSKQINAKGYHPIGIEEQDKCIGCAFCARMCPDAVIKVEK